MSVKRLLRWKILLVVLAVCLAVPAAAWAAFGAGDLVTTSDGDGVVVTDVTFVRDNSDGVLRPYETAKVKPRPTPTPTPTATPEPTPTATPEPTPTATPTPTPEPASGDYLAISAAKLAALPTSGTTWDYLNTTATAGLSVTPNLHSYDSSGRTNVKIWALALRYARTGNASDRSAVESKLRYVVGCEVDTCSSASVDNRMLSTARHLASYVMAADLIHFDPTLTGSRSGWTSTRFIDWLDTAIHRNIGPNSRWPNVWTTSDDTDANQGAAAIQSRLAVALYSAKVGRPNGDLTAAVARFKRFMGDATSGVPPFNNTAAYDPSWACIPSGEIWPSNTNARPINPDVCGSGKAGYLHEDIARSDFAYPGTNMTTTDAGVGYSTETAQYLTVAAIMLTRAGYPAFTWDDKISAAQIGALRRMANKLNERGWLATGTGSSVERVLAFALNGALGTTYPTATSAGTGRTVCCTDWLYKTGL